MGFSFGFYVGLAFILAVLVLALTGHLALGANFAIK